ncbi:ATP-binding protein [Spectribacter hydrogenoxidans]|uniref:ATP-binding protein n=1 Tax=Spectribacter hydrogenoxidans TaxID=3075608 RepID=A0ABU3C002_9GAMM|nr:ATP-binding protein [Salinisphaera sp. W335]MDT0634869.1 ATP-binding protein [Salinisphaera sp. W335]
MSSCGDSDNPWVEHLTYCDTRKYLYERATVIPKPLRDLTKSPADVAIAQLERAFEQSFYASEQAVSLLETILAMVRRGAATRYTNKQEFIRALYSGEPPKGSAEPLCLTGLAGTGKSKLLAACGRILPPQSDIEVDDHHSPFPFQNAWHLLISASPTLKSILTELARQSGQANLAPRTAERLQHFIERAAYRNGVLLLTVDEFQYLSHSANANTLSTKFLLALRGIGCPLVYAANYSLVRQLQKRNQEDRQRLLNHVYLLEREDIDSADWQGLIESYCAIAPEVFRIDAARDASDLWHLSGGLPRMLRRLMITAYQKARSHDQSAVKLHDIKEAFKSNSFSVMREDIQLLAGQAIDGQDITRHPDLNPPIKSAQKTPPNARAATIDNENQKNAEAVQMSSLTVAERKAVEQSRKAPKKSLRRQESDDDLLNNLREFKARQ